MASGPAWGGWWPWLWGEGWGQSLPASGPILVAAGTWSLPLFPVLLSHPLNSSSYPIPYPLPPKSPFSFFPMPHANQLLNCFHWSGYTQEVVSFTKLKSYGFLVFLLCSNSGWLFTFGNPMLQLRFVVCVCVYDAVDPRASDGCVWVHCLKFKEKLIYTWLCCVTVAACGLSLVVASRGCSLLWCVGFSVQWPLVVELGLEAHGLRQLRHRGSVFPWHVESSQTRDRTCFPCIGRQILIHCTSGEISLTFSKQGKC